MPTCVGTQRRSRAPRARDPHTGHIRLGSSTAVALSAGRMSSGSIPLPTRMVLGAVAGMGAATCCHPLDVLRVQMQTEGVQYKGTMDAAVQIFRRNGLREGLYAGVSAAYLRAIPPGSRYMCCALRMLPTDSVVVTAQANGCMARAASVSTPTFSRRRRSRTRRTGATRTTSRSRASLVWAARAAGSAHLSVLPRSSLLSG